MGANNPPVKKKCSICNETKDLYLFYKNKKSKDGRLCRCKVCDEKIHEEWRKNNKDHEQTMRRERYNKNREANINRAIEWNKANPERAKKAKDKWNDKNKRKIAKAQKAWRDKNIEMVRNTKKIWRENNIEKVRECARQHNKKMRSTPKGKLHSSFAISIYKTLRGVKNGRRWECLVGYTVDELKKHLEKQFTDGMTWENYGEWHVDHKIPKSVFNYETPEDIDFKKCWALSNLQPLWKLDNLIKYNKLTKPFQPSLAMAI
jgi:hypothetical protein